MKDIKRVVVIGICTLVRSGFKRARLLKRVRYFYHQGEGCFFSTVNFGTEPYLLSFGDNVHVATGVRFITHDVTGNMLNRMEKTKKYTNRIGSISVGDHVVIGANALILYDVKIGDRVVIGAGSVVTSDLEADSVYAGVPARRIGASSDYYEKVRAFSENADWDETMRLSVRREKQTRYFWKERPVRVHRRFGRCSKQKS